LEIELIGYQKSVKLYQNPIRIFLLYIKYKEKYATAFWEPLLGARKRACMASKMSASGLLLDYLQVFYRFLSIFAANSGFSH